MEPFTEYFAGIDPECAAVLAKPEESARTTPNKIDDCEEKAVAQRKGYRDLDQATRSTNAVEDAAWLSILQTRASVVGAAFLVLTLFATAWAAWAAADAARVAEKAATAAQVSADISQREFSLTHRPKIRVRRVRIHPPTAGKPIVVEAEMVNIGGGEADVFFIEYRVSHRGNRRSGSGTLPLEGGDVRRMASVSVGASRVIAIPTSLMWEDEFGSSRERLVVSGQASYQDTFIGSPNDPESRRDFQPIARKTAFQRFWHGPTGLRFVKADNPDPEYEYED